VGSAIIVCSRALKDSRLTLDAIGHPIQNARMKQCPECSAEYDDNTRFCAKDGRALVAKVASRTRLCPHCANSIPEASPKCPYCKAELGSSTIPEWPKREEELRKPKIPARIQHHISNKSRLILIAGIVVFAVGVFLVGSQKQRNQSQSVLRQKLTELQQKEQTIQERDKRIEESDQKIRALEKQLGQTRQQLTDNNNDLATLKTKLDESKRDLSVAQQRLGIANREIDRLASSRTQTVAKSPPRSMDQTLSPASPPLARRAADPGVYETVRQTSVYDDPSASGRVLSQISKGTKVDVVRSVGDWLEVRSKHGNPPGFIRLDDAVFVSRLN
jgi:hypothetical protein